MTVSEAIRRDGFNQFKRTFLWKTKEGDRLRLDQMATTHLFHCLRILLNRHVGDRKMAELFRRAYNGDYSPQSQLSWTIFYFIVEIEVRNDLPGNFRPQYGQILERMFDRQFLNGELHLARTRWTPTRVNPDTGEDVTTLPDQRPSYMQQLPLLPNDNLGRLNIPRGSVPSPRGIASDPYVSPAVRAVQDELTTIGRRKIQVDDDGSGDESL